MGAENMGNRLDNVEVSKIDAKKDSIQYKPANNPNKDMQKVAEAEDKATAENLINSLDNPVKERDYDALNKIEYIQDLAKELGIPPALDPNGDFLYNGTLKALSEDLDLVANTNNINIIDTAYNNRELLGKARQQEIELALAKNPKTPRPILNNIVNIASNRPGFGHNTETDKAILVALANRDDASNINHADYLASLINKSDINGAINYAGTDE